MLSKLMVPGVIAVAFVAALAGTLVMQGRLGEVLGGTPPATGPTQAQPAGAGQQACQPVNPAPGRAENNTGAHRSAQSAELEALVADLKRSKAGIVRQGKTLQQQEERIRTYRSEIEAEKKTIAGMRAEISRREADLATRETALKEQVVQIDAVKAAALKKLAAFYEAMAPEQASAKLLAESPEDAARILFFMTEKKGAKLLESFPNDTRSLEVFKHFKRLHEEAAQEQAGDQT